MLAALPLLAGSSGLNVIVVVNQNSSNSLQLANDYCELRNVPPQNVLRLTNTWSGGSVYCSADEFQTNLLTPLLGMIDANGLGIQAQLVLLSMDLPYTVVGTNGWNSTTSALFYGFKPDDAPPGPNLPASCSLPAAAFNSYAFSEMAFADNPPTTAPTNAFLAMLLTDTNLATAEATMRRAIASDGTFPDQSVILEKTSDPFRNVRFYEFDNSVFEAQVRGDNAVSRILSDSTGITNLLGLQTGLTTYSIPANAYVPGSIGDNLTSYGGRIFNSAGQTVLLEFLEAGAAASYGTVVEPCNYPQKFPSPLDYFYQLRGFCNAESYYQSVQYPYQGLMVGEPLAAPFALRGAGEWGWPDTNAVVLTGLTNLTATFSAAGVTLPLSRVDLFIDGTYYETVTNIPPTAGDILSVSINGVPSSYVVPPNASISSVASGLAVAINAASGINMVGAEAVGDRILLRSLDAALPGASISVQSSASNALGSPTTYVNAARGTFLDSVATGYHNILVSNTPAVGDWLRLDITETNGQQYSYSVTNQTEGTTIGQFMVNLYNTIYSASALDTPSGLYPTDFDDESSSGYADFDLYANTAGLSASALQVTFTASPDLVVQTPATSLLQDNLSDLQARNHLYIASGNLSLFTQWPLATTALADGYHQLTAVAYEGTSVQTQTIINQNVIVQNTPLLATLNTLYGGSNTDVGATLQFSVVANTNPISTIQLYSTGGLLATATNVSTATFAVPGATLGVGLHPFYALVTSGSGAQYRTATTWIRLIGAEPTLSMSATANPLTLNWSATAGRAYGILMATNLNGPFNLIDTVTPSNNAGVWIDTNTTTSPSYYLLRTPP
jgi:uncharacterized protein (TIGR03790 family)